MVPVWLPDRLPPGSTGMCGSTDGGYPIPHDITDRTRTDLFTQALTCTVEQ